MQTTLNASSRKPFLVSLLLCIRMRILLFSQQNSRKSYTCRNVYLFFGTRRQKVEFAQVLFFFAVLFLEIAYQINIFNEDLLEHKQITLSFSGKLQKQFALKNQTRQHSRNFWL